MTREYLRCESTITRLIVACFPNGVRGGGLIGSILIRLARVNPIAQLRVGDRWLRINLTYRTHFALAISGSEFEPGTSKLLASALTRGDTYLDVGANWGIFAIVASHFVEQTGRVIAVEANPRTFRHLSNAIRDNGVTNCLALNYAISSTNGQLVRMEKPWWRNDTAGYLKTAGEGRSDSFSTISLTIDTIWALMGSPKVKLFKLDVEGFEPLVLLGAVRFLHEGLQGGAIIEVSEWCKLRCGVEWEQIFHTMERAGFRSNWKIEPSGRIQPLENLARETGYIVFSKETSFMKAHLS